MALTTPPVQKAGSQNSAGSTTIAQAFSSNVTAGNMIVVGIGCDGTAISSVTDNQGNTYQLAEKTSGSDLLVYYATGVAGGATTVTVTFSASATFRSILINEYTISGGVQLDQVAVTSAGTATGGTVTSPSITTTANGDLIYALATDASQSLTWGAGTGYTLEGTSSGTTGFIADEDQIQATAGAITASFTGFHNTDVYNFIIVSFKPGTVHTSSGSGTITLSGSNSASITFAPSESGSVQLTGSNSATFQAVGSDEGSITLSGSNAPSIVFGSSGSGSITLTGSNTVSFVGPSPPANTIAPAISGAPAYDSYGNLSLSCSTGTWTGTAPITYAYQWQEDDDGDGVFVNIPGATSSTLQVANSVTPYVHLGNAIRCVVSATNSLGTVSADSAPTILVYVSPTIAARGSVQLIADFGFALSPGFETFPDTNVYPEGEEATLNHTSPGSSSLIPADFP